jgi:hypothetical protein
MRVLSEESKLVTVGQPHRDFAFLALEGGGRHEPSASFDDQVVTVFALKGEIGIPQSD